MHVKPTCTFANQMHTFEALVCQINNMNNYEFAMKFMYLFYIR